MRERARGGGAERESNMEPGKDRKARDRGREDRREKGKEV